MTPPQAVVGEGLALHVAVIDDDPAILRLTTMILEGQGCRLRRSPILWTP